ncbi:hypothetical protein FAM23868_001877 [Propionibacterium freudenreichii]|uniref:hypothetical protein n=1 Tax=Propionibacterium freudenreichii TaxID=1744 RepID=UPI00254F2836|nr:hypothetical protein [Propionibacterium freudenreichii]MDK9332540.1 hypothetical protein [Propionibacterium freudenreichii]
MDQPRVPLTTSYEMLEVLTTKFGALLDGYEAQGVRAFEEAGEPYDALDLLLSDLHFKGVKIPKEYADKIWSITDPEDVEDFAMYLGPRPKA